MSKRLLFILVPVALLAAAGGFVWLRVEHKTPVPTATTTAPIQPAKNTQAADNFDKTAHSITGSSSLWVIANKKHPLAKGYGPAKLVVPNVPLRLGQSEEQMQVSATMAPALESLVTGAKKDGINLKLSSGYRSEALQTQFYNAYVAKDGVAAADTYSARPGTSEHQTGLASDMIPANDKCHLEVCFADLPEGQWLAKHAHEYGFIIRYLKGKDQYTTYQYEPWHIRYVGVDLADQLYSNGLTMEEFFGYTN